MNKGFSIMQNAPWCLIADLGSPAMIPYYENRNIKSVNSFLASRFKFANRRDMPILINKLNYNYNSLIILHPYQRQVKITCKNNSKINIIDRSPIDSTLQLSNYWIKMYTEVRNIEEKKPFNSHQVNTIIRKATKKLITPLDKHPAFSYIDGRFNANLFERPWGFAHLQRRTIKAKEQELKQKLSDSLTGLPSTGGSGGSSGGY